MSEIVFPAIDSTKALPFKLIWQMMKTTPGLLDLPGCPYSDDVKLFLKAAFGPQKSAEVHGLLLNNETITDEDLEFLPDDPVEELEEVDMKVKRLLATLELVAKNIKMTDTKEQIDIAKAQSVLFDRLLGIRERTLNAKAVVEFQQQVLDIIDQCVNADDRTEVMVKLRALTGEQQ